jgi:hypothetical protein
MLCPIRIVLFIFKAKILIFFLDISRNNCCIVVDAHFGIRL